MKKPYSAHIFVETILHFIGRNLFKFVFLHSIFFKDLIFFGEGRRLDLEGMEDLSTSGKFRGPSILVYFEP